MNDQLQGGPKSEEVAAILNRTLAELVIRCSREDGVRDYFDVGVLGYGYATGSTLGGNLSSDLLYPISEVADNPLRVEDRTRRESDGVGGIVELDVKFPVWVEPEAAGGTPMRAAIAQAARALVPWADAHPNSFPPVVIHLTDGESTDGDPEPVAEQLRNIHTNDGNLLMMNIHITGASSRTIAFPATADDLSDRYAAMLFRMSSTLAGYMLDQARALRYQVTETSRAYMFDAHYEHIVHFLNIGTPQAQVLR